MTNDDAKFYFKSGASLLDLDDDTPAGSAQKPIGNGYVQNSVEERPAQKPASTGGFIGSLSKEASILPQIANDAMNVLNKASLTSYANEVKTVMAESKSQNFTVAVVGEFSRGKSTFVNKLLGKDILPVSNMPTTAMLTRIRHSQNEGITIFDATNKTKKTLPLSAKSWANYVASDDGNDPNGVAFVGINSPWLKNGIEIIDTPGAGDLEASRAKLIGDALKSSDSAIITISALSALSMSEKLFIEERLIMKKTPFLMLIVTKLDQVDVKQRNGIIDYIKEKLKIWKFNGIDVFIPHTVEMPDDKYKSIMGMDKIVKRINTWMVSSDRKRLTEQWTALKLKSNLKSAIEYAKECQCLMAESDMAKKNQMLDQKAQMLEKADKVWDETKMQMMQRMDECIDLFFNKVESYKESLIEKLQYEASHVSSPQKWWNEDFPYKLKIEMTNLSNATEAIVSRSYTKDSTWFNSVIERNFKTSVLVSADDEITDREQYSSYVTDDSLQLTDLGKSRNLSRIGMAALTIGAALAFNAIGISTLFATTGISTGGGMLSETIFKKKTDEQRQILRDEIVKRMPEVVQNATAHSEARIRNMYMNVIKEATRQQENWIESQKAVISSASDTSKSGIKFDPNTLIGELTALCDRIDAKYSC